MLQLIRQITRDDDVTKRTLIEPKLISFTTHTLDKSWPSAADKNTNQYDITQFVDLPSFNQVEVNLSLLLLILLSLVKFKRPHVSDVQYYM